MNLIVSLASIAAVTTSLTAYVKPFVGTSNFGTTNPGAVCPNGMMSVSPFNVMGSEKNRYDKDSRWWSTPYTSDNCFFTGFSHVNLSGVGCPELGSLLTMPICGELQTDYKIYGSEYSREYAEPGYYSNFLEKYQIFSEVSATLRTSIERYTFPGGKGHILLNLGQGLTNESGSWLRYRGEREIEGMKLLGTFCYNSQAVFPIYFVLRVSKKPSESGFWKKQRKMTAEAAWDKDQGKYKIYKNYFKELAGDDIGYWFSFDSLAKGEQVEVRMGVSFVSVENARENLDKEQGSLSFEQIKNHAHELWEKDLGRIKVFGASEKDKEIFYTALYHSLLHPNILNDVNGEYPLMEGGRAYNSQTIEEQQAFEENEREAHNKKRENFKSGIGKVEEGHNRYTVFSLWDTYRNVHQLLSLVFPERQSDMVRSMIDMYKEWGWMPKWELYGRETFTMEGDPAIPVIADTYLKGIRDYDIHTAYEAFIKSATTPGANNLLRPDIDPYIQKGYVPLGFYSADFSGDNSVSHALEYYVADFSLSNLAKELGKKKDAEIFKKRSLGYKNYYCKDFGMLRPKTKDGKFLEPFNPRQGENFEPVPGFHEGSAWNYTFYVPHDIKGLIKLMGGGKRFVEKLQKVFDEGLYDPSNEPDIAYPYLFSYVKGEEWRTQKTVKSILDKYYGTHSAGLPGNDDTGTMSAWAVFSMMGFYPDCPGEPYYTFTSPIFDRVEISLSPKYNLGKERLVIKRQGNDRVKNIAMKGKTSGKSMRLKHQDMIEVGEILINCEK